jgi:hypothetical protein
VLVGRDVFVELAESLRCLEDHEPTFLVVMPSRMDGRTIVEGLIGCPVCRREYGIANGVAYFDAEDVVAPETARFAPLPVDGEGAQALINLSGPGGLVILIGSAARLAAQLADLVAGVHFVVCNPPADVTMSERISLFRAGRRLPFRSSIARAVVVGEEHVNGKWPDEAVRVLLRGLRLVLFGDVSLPLGITELAVGPRVLVGEKS